MKNIDYLKKVPLIQTKIRRIKDTNLILHQTIISDIRPIEYYEAALDKDDETLEVSIDKVVA